MVLEEEGTNRKKTEKEGYKSRRRKENRGDEMRRKKRIGKETQ